MKTLKIITHPVTIIIWFLFILIIGEHLGGFYLLYILLALPHGSAHAVLATLGIILLLLNKYIYDRKLYYWIKPLLNIAGVVMLPLSLFLFFYTDKDHYNESTFYQAVPVTILGIFFILVIIFFLKNIIYLIRHNDVNNIH